MNRRTIVIAAVVIFVAAVAFTIINAINPVKVVESYPAEGSRTFKAYEDIVLTFNETPAADMVNQVKITPTVNGKASISGNKLTYTAFGGFKGSTEYTLSIDKPIDTKGNEGKPYTLHFSPVFVAFADLPKEEQQKQIQATDRHEQTDPFTQFLPYDDDLDYSIDFKYDNQDHVVYMVTLNVAKLGSNDPTYIPALKNAKTKADNWIKSKGYDPNVLKPVYNPDPNTGAYTPN